MVEGVRVVGESKEDDKQDNPERCEVCQLTTAKRQISRRPNARKFGRSGSVHFDLIQIDPGYNGHRWITHFYIDGIRLHVAFTHERKNGCQDAVKEFVAYARNQWNFPIKAFRYDNERSAGRTVEDYMAEEGFVVEHSVVGTPEQNSFAERSGGVIITVSRSLIIDSGLPKTLWPEAIQAAVWILNRSPTKMPDGKWIIPYQEALTLASNTPLTPINLANIRIYGCRAYVRKQGIPKADKMQTRAEIGYLVGYKASNIWKIWFPQRAIVQEVRDVTFDENRLFNPEDIAVEQIRNTTEMTDWLAEDSGSETEENPSNQKSQIRRESQGEPLNQSKSAQQSKGKNQQLLSPSLTPTRMFRNEQDPTDQLQDELMAAIPPRAPRDIDGDVDERNIITGSRVRKPKEFSFYTDNSYEDGTLSAFATGLNEARSHTKAHKDELPPAPENWREMMKHPYREGFLEASALELKTLQRKETYQVIQRPNDKSIQILPLRWVFTYKFDSDGFLVKLKARICVRGDLQKITAEEKYSATLAARTARAVLALVAAFDLDTYQFDAVNAFLNSILDEEVITEFPEGYRQPGQCWRLRKALYGLRKSPRLWQREATKILTKLGFQVVQEDLCLFVSDGIIIFFYVDDIIIVNHPSQAEQARELRQQLAHEWELRDIGESAWFLGIRITRDRDRKALWLCQDSYISSMASRYHLTHLRQTATPLPNTLFQEFNGKATPGQIHEFQQKVGSALYVTTITRPDVAKHIAVLAQFLRNPGPEHLDAINRVIAYLYHTRSYAITYRPRQSDEIEAVSFFTDASFADNPDRKSSEGYICMIFGGPVEWRAGKQRTVTTSTTEAELLAISEGAKTIQMWKRLFTAIRFDPEHPLSIKCDNQQTVGLLTKEQPQLRTKLRHVDIHHHWLRQEVQAENITVQWTETNEMIADGLTKLLPRQKHADFVRQLGMEDIENLLD
ncbi:hypothetical protein N7456_007069 [Penicillium angulare]|uniref:Integrase catalytic domain-containing protein n=1 Tax=Penicillium angulare TaxID=116970 RepID=A0A9W9FJD3_9EURO|nr:hypothetical protein N7456_007069 [Penicillium angulare]